MYLSLTRRALYHLSFTGVTRWRLVFRYRLSFLGIDSAIAISLCTRRDLNPRLRIKNPELIPDSATGARRYDSSRCLLSPHHVALLS